MATCKCSACAASDPGPSTVVNHPHAATRMASSVPGRCSSPFGGQYFAIRELEARDVHRQTGRVHADLAGLCAVRVAGMLPRNETDPGGERWRSFLNSEPSPMVATIAVAVFGPTPLILAIR